MTLRHRRTGFTLVELLIVIVIIAVLMAILLPVISGARRRAYLGSCMNNLRQIGMALKMYKDDTNGLDALRISATYPVFVSNHRLFHCPLDNSKGQFRGTDRVEGNLFLGTGVSYGYIPRWQKAVDLGWWPGTEPPYGFGKYAGMTPLAECNWHWATFFDPDKPFDDPGSGQGVVLILQEDGAVIRVQARDWPEGHDRRMKSVAG